MSEKAVDDMYFGCTEQMTNENKDKDERGRKFDECIEKAKKTKHEGLHTKHIQALCTYTSDGLYGDFNTAVREGKDKYLDKNFRYNSLHFWLTDAIQILNKDLSRTKKCLTVYRRTTVKFIGEENKIIRLGSFSSTSHRTDLTDFGKETCFVIETCLAAYVADYSSYNQEEVLIPPYETFKITKKIENNKDKPAGLTDCKVVYELKHAGGKSVLNCKTSGVAAAAREVTQQN